MEETFKLIGHVTSLIPYKDSSRPQRLAVVEAKSRKDAAAHTRLTSTKRFTNLNLHCVSRTLAVLKMKIDFHRENKMLAI